MEVVVWRHGGVDGGGTCQGGTSICTEDEPMEDDGGDTYEYVRPVCAPGPVCGSVGASDFRC